VLKYLSQQLSRSDDKPMIQKSKQHEIYMTSPSITALHMNPHYHDFNELM